MRVGGNERESEGERGGCEEEKECNENLSKEIALIMFKHHV